MSTAARGGIYNKYRHAVMVTRSWSHLRGSLVREKRKQPRELEGLGLTPTTQHGKLSVWQQAGPFCRLSICFVIHKITVGWTEGILSSLSALKLYAPKLWGSRSAFFYKLALNQMRLFSSWLT